MWCQMNLVRIGAKYSLCFNVIKLVSLEEERQENLTHHSISRSYLMNIAEPEAGIVY